MYAQEVHRDDYQNLAPEMLGSPGIIQVTQHAQCLPGLDVVIGTGFRIATNAKSLAALGHNGVHGNLFVTGADLTAIDTKNGRRYVVVQTQPGVNVGQLLRQAAIESVRF
jgi:hypothetical protein